MNETILNGLLNLFAVFASAVRIEEQQASRAVHFYLSINYNMVADKKTSTTTGRHLPLFATFQRLHAIILHL